MRLCMELNNNVSQLICFLVLNIALRQIIKTQAHNQVMRLLLFIGVPLHESAHYIIAKLTLRKIIKAGFIPDFSKSPPAYIAYNNSSSITGYLIDALIGLAPLYLGVCALVNIPQPDILAINTIIDALFFLIIWGVVLAVAQSMLPSLTDLKNSVPGSVIAIFSFLILNNLDVLPEVCDEKVVELLLVPLHVLTFYQALLIIIILLCKNRRLN